MIHNEITSDVLYRMKAKKGDKLLEMNCTTCEFNMSGRCGGHGLRLDNGEDTYAMVVSEALKMFPNGCEDYGISFKAFVQQEKLNGR